METGEKGERAQCAGVDGLIATKLVVDGSAENKRAVKQPLSLRTKKLKQLKFRPL